jgi:hypothetical protein
MNNLALDVLDIGAIFACVLVIVTAICFVILRIKGE